jgi:hypothetical protein
MWCTTTRWRRTTESTSSRASATQTRTRPTLSRDKEVGHFGTFMGHLFRAKEVGHFGTFMGHFGTFTSNPFQSPGGWAFLNFYVQPFLGPSGWNILDIRNFLMQTFLRPKSKDINFFASSPFNWPRKWDFLEFLGKEVVHFGLLDKSF